MRPGLIRHRFDNPKVKPRPRRSVGVIERHVRLILKELHPDWSARDVAETPNRVARALLELTAGYEMPNPAGLLAKRFEAHGYDEVVILRDIAFASLCEHHLLPFTGKAHVAYLAGTKIVGLSKLARLVDAYARRFQVQERMTNQIAGALASELSPRGVAVVIEAAHSCMANRGVAKAGATMVTSAMFGVFRSDPAARAEVLRLMGR